MDELIRSQVHDALEIAPPAGLRPRVIASVPMDRPRAGGRIELRMGWAGGFLAGLLTAAVVAALSLSYSALHNSPKTTGPAQPSLISPEGIAVAPDGAVYVSDYIGDRVFRIGAGGRLIPVAGGGSGGTGPATKAWLWHPSAIAFDKQGDLFIADSIGGTIRRVDTHGVISTFSLAAAPLGLAFDSDGALYEAGYYGDIHVYNSNIVSTGIDLSTLPRPAPQFSYMTFSSAGDLYVADRAPVLATHLDLQNPNGGCRIIRASPTRAMRSAIWKVTAVAGTGTCGFSGDEGQASQAQLNNPAGIAFDSAGNLYIADTDNHRIRRVAPDGTISTIAGTGEAGYAGDGGPAINAQVESPAGMAVAPGNLLYFSDATCGCMDPTTNGRVRMINLSTGVITTVVRG